MSKYWWFINLTASRRLHYNCCNFVLINLEKKRKSESSVFSPFIPTNGAAVQVQSHKQTFYLKNWRTSRFRFEFNKQKYRRNTFLILRRVKGHANASAAWLLIPLRLNDLCKLIQYFDTFLSRSRNHKLIIT